MQDKSLKQEIPDYMLMTYHINDVHLSVFMDAPDGQSRRRQRREQERKNKKK